MVNVQKGFLFVPLALFNSCLSCRKACDRHAVRRAGHIRKPDLVAELDGRRIAAMLAADTAVHFGTNTSSLVNCHFHELSYTRRIKSCERIALVNLVRVVAGKELAGVVAGEAEGHLR